MNLPSLKEDEVLFFTRIHGKKGIFNKYYPTELLDIFTSIDQYRTISEYSASDIHINVDLNLLNRISKEDFILMHNTLDIDDIIIRCRGLRNISREEATQLIWVVAKFFIDFFKKESDLKLIVSLIVDNYVMDIMERMAKEFKVEILQVIGFFVPGYFRVTDRFGHGLKIRDVNEDEINKVYKRLLLKGKSHMAVSKNKALKNSIRDYFSYRYRYLFRYLLGYKILNNLSYEYRFAKYFKGFNTVNKLLVNNYFDNIDSINEESNRLIFLPLHYHPEATVDYWSENNDQADYLNSIIKTLSVCRSYNLKVIIKEHPNYYLRRSKSFYNRIRQFDNIYLLDPFIPSQNVVDMVDNVCVYTGSVGVESIMLDKKVFILSENYYSFKRLPLLKDFEERYIKFTEYEKKELIRKLLETTLNVGA